MRYWRLASAVVGMVLTLGMLLSGCGSAHTSTVGRLATATATITPYPTATTDPASVEFAGCPAVALGPVAPAYTAVAGLKVSIPQRWTSLDYPSALLPNNAPSAPYQVPLTADEAQSGIFQPTPPVNPALKNGYALQVCNQTDAAHTLIGLNVTIASFAPSSGSVAVWHLCADGPFDAATGQTTGGCGGSLGGVDWLAATLPSASTGATAPAIANAKEDHAGPSLPIALAPNTSIVLLVAVNGLTSQGTYTLSFDLSLDGASPTGLAPSDGAFLLAPAATIWTGTACQAPAMRAHIPVASHDIYYVCPPAD